MPTVYSQNKRKFGTHIRKILLSHVIKAYTITVEETGRGLQSELFYYNKISDKHFINM